MIFDGIKFRKSKTIIMLPFTDENGNLMPYVDPSRPQYIIFGKLIKDNSQPPETAIKIHNLKWESGRSVYATVIELSGHSLTNMAYSKDKRHIYLAYNGSCFIASRTKKS